MTKWARIEENIGGEKEAMEVIDFDPMNRFHPSIEWVECDDDTQERMIYDEGTETFSSP